MGNEKFYNVKDVALVFTTNVPGAFSFDATKTGVAEDATITIEGPTDQVTLKEDLTGKYAEFSQKNSRKTTITISAMRGTPLHRYMSLIYEAQINGIIDVNINAAYKHPLDFFVKNFVGRITGYPRESIQGELETLEYQLVGVADSVQDIIAKNTLL